MTFIRVPRVLLSACLLAAALCPAFPLAQSASECVVGGTIASGSTPLPGVVVSLVAEDGKPIDVSSTGPDGSYALRLRPTEREASAERAKPEREALAERAKYAIKAELVAFAPLTHELTGVRCQERVDLAMTLASRAPRTESSAP